MINAAVKKLGRGVGGNNAWPQRDVYPVTEGHDEEDEDDEDLADFGLKHLEQRRFQQHDDGGGGTASRGWEGTATITTTTSTSTS